MKWKSLPNQLQRRKVMYLGKDFEHTFARNICLNKVFEK